MNNSRRNGGGLFTFIVGIAAGAAAGYYLSTEEGRRVRERLQSRSNDFAGEASTYARQTGTKVNANLNTALDQSRSYVNDLTANVKSKVDEISTNARQQIDRTNSAFSEGVARGKEKLNQQKAEIDNLVQSGTAEAERTAGDRPDAGADAESDAKAS